ncbi:MAG: UbiD family decarboxylase [Candidatus Thermoplasmatota archaeon]|nr:UbiD family decarboxylase [Candidatus Thermoplasmatota archaeon]
MNDQFVRIKEKVSKKLQITEIAKTYGNRPILLENLEGKRGVLNLWADRERIYEELGMKREQFLSSYESSLSETVPLTEGEKHFRTKVRISDVPVCWHYPRDAGFYITSGIFVAERGGKRNLSIHRVFIENEEGGYVRLVPRDLLRMYNDAVSHGEEMRVSIVIGSPLEFLLAAATSVPFEHDESEIAASLYLKSKGKAMQFSRSKFGLLVPADSDYVINATLTGKTREEGPFKDVTGTYDIQEGQPQILFDSVEAAKNPIYHALVPATMEHFNLMGLPREPTIFNEIRGAGVDVKDVRLSEGGASWLHGIVKIRKSSEKDFERTVEASFRGHRSLKRVIVVDEDINIYDDRDVEWALATRFQADKGLIIKKERGSSLDPSSYEGNLTSKMGMDATMPIGGGRKFLRDII